MTREEAAALKVGDEILVRMIVREDGLDREGDAQLTSEGYDWWVPPSSVHSLAPPKPLAVGDRVRASTAPLGQPMTILGIRGYEVWCEYEPNRTTLRDINKLTRVPA